MSTNQVVAFRESLIPVPACSPFGNQQISEVIDRCISKNTLKTTNWCLIMFWCEHRVIAERVKTLSDEDLNASGQNSLNLVYINKIYLCQEGYDPIYIYMFCEASEAPSGWP